MKSLLSFLDIQMCFISSFTSERADLPEDEREESVAMAEGYNYIKTLPPRQWVIMLSHTSVFSRLYLLTAPEQRCCLTNIILLTPRTVRAAPPCAISSTTLGPTLMHDVLVGATGYQWKFSVTNKETSPF